MTSTVEVVWMRKISECLVCKEMYYNDQTEIYFWNPIIAAVRDGKFLQQAIDSDVTSIFLLTGSLLDVDKTVTLCRERQKFIFIHTDLIEGLGNDFGGIKYIAERVKPDGLISTRNNVIKSAKELGIYTIQRYFCVDSLAIHTGIKTIEQTNPDAVEILPGVIPRAVKQIGSCVRKPILTGGMVVSKEDVLASLNSGAVGVSTSCLKLWNE